GGRPQVRAGARPDRVVARDPQLSPLPHHDQHPLRRRPLAGSIREHPPSGLYERPPPRRSLLVVKPEANDMSWMPEPDPTPLRLRLGPRAESPLPVSPVFDDAIVESIEAAPAEPPA